MIVARSLRYLCCRYLGRRPSSPTSISSVQTKIRRSRAVRSSSKSSPPPNRDSARSAPIPVATRSGGIVRSINFCQWCGGRTKHEVPDGEEKLRAICTLCSKIAYQNPKCVLGGMMPHQV